MRAITSNTFNGPAHITQGDVYNHVYLRDLLPVARTAGFDSHAEEHNAQCLPDTRTDLLRQIQQWATDPGGECIFWLNGMAGTGKSTIARTMASWARKQGLLGASFFFKRGERDRGHAGLFFTTLASQLAARDGSLNTHVQDALRADPALPGKAFGEQYDKLVLQPLDKARGKQDKPPSVLVVIDALDECQPEADIRLIIYLLSCTKTMSSGEGIRILITSRPELPIRLGFKSIEGKYEEIILHSIPVKVIKHDIYIFIKYEIDKIRREYNKSIHDGDRVPSDWPGQQMIHMLVENSVPLFIYAATICRFIGDRRHGNPIKQLNKVLEYPTGTLTSRLEGAYRPVLDQLVVNMEEPQREDVIKEFQTVVGSLIILADPLPLDSLAALLGIDRRDVQDIINPLHSVLRVPPATDPNSPVQLLHLSFYDFLVDPTTRSKNMFWIDERQRQIAIADRCLDILENSLKKNICSLSTPGTLRTEITSGLVEDSLPAHVRYACLFWVYHLNRGQARLIDGQRVHLFLTTHLLHWLEALSLMGRISDSIDAVSILGSMIESISNSRVTHFLRDIRRFVLHWQSTIDASPLQIYSSALIFTPEQSLVRRTFEKDVSKWIIGYPEIEQNWSACLQTLEGHANGVQSVQFSKDGRLLVSASDDHTVRIWNLLNGKCTQILEGHTLNVTHAIFSNEDKHIISASLDRSIRVWSTITGKCLRRMDCDSGIKSIACSHNGGLVVSASFEKVVRTWDTDSGECIATFEGHQGPINSVAFSPDGRCVASAADDKTARIWDIKTKMQLQKFAFRDWSATLVAFSHEGVYLATAMGASRIEIWDWKSEDKFQTIIVSDGTNYIRCMAFSPDDNYIAWASNEGTINISNISTGKLVQSLRGHTSWVNSVTYSKDCRYLASASLDKTISVWDLMDAIDEQTSSKVGTRRNITSVTFSNDNKLLATTCSKATIHIWDVASGLCFQVLRGHEEVVSMVAFANKNKYLVSGSYDRTVKIWNCISGTCLRTTIPLTAGINSITVSNDAQRVIIGLKDRAPFIVWENKLWEIDPRLQAPHIHKREDHCTGTGNSMSLSTDNKYLALASILNTINIWDLEDKTKQCLMTLQDHNERITAVSFFQNGARLVSASIDNTVKIWDTSTGECLRTFDFKRVVKEITVDAETGHIRTELGCFKIDKVDPSKKSHVVNEKPLQVGYGFSDDNAWITWNSTKLLWLPPQYRTPFAGSHPEGPSLAAVGGSIVAIGHESWVPLIINFAPDCDLST